MDSVKLNENICRICLKHNAILNWNDCIFEFSEISYKNCYYQYTKLQETDSDCFPTNLCEFCGNGLKNAHVFFEKALKSFKILQDLLERKQAETTQPSKYDEQDFGNIDSTMADKRMTGTDDEISLRMRDSERVPKNENQISIDKTTMNDAIIEPEHFIDIQILKSSASTNKTRNKRRKCNSIPTNLLGETCYSKLHISLPTKKTSKRKKKSEHLLENSQQQQIDEISLVQNITGNCRIQSPLQAPNSARQSREKYLLMCAYCSLKVRGARKLRDHEATHSENRERTEACPQCGLKLYTKLTLSEHMKIHDKNRQKNHKCEFCEKAFFNKGALNVHRRIHLGLMVKCQICSKEYYRQVDLDRHLLKHSASPLERNVEEKKYVVQCEYCNKSVKTCLYKEHIAAHLDQPQVKCKVCDKNFFSRLKCTKHLRQVHHKISTEYDAFIHYYVHRYRRMTSLLAKQQLRMQPLEQ